MPQQKIIFVKYNFLISIEKSYDGMKIGYQVAKIKGCKISVSKHRLELIIKLGGLEPPCDYAIKTSIMRSKRKPVPIIAIFGILNLRG